MQRNKKRRGRHSFTSILFLILIGGIGYLQSRPRTEDETVVDVLDGDSLVIVQAGKRQEIRLYAIDCPEKNQAFGRDARAFTRDLVKGRPVTLKIYDRDQYGRLVCEVFLEDGRSLNHELVLAGCAWWYRDHAEHNRSLKRVEARAREEKRGLWSAADPIPPWEFRRRARKQS